MNIKIREPQGKLPPSAGHRMEILRAWARTHFTSGWVLDIGSVGSRSGFLDSFLISGLRHDISIEVKLVASDIDINGLNNLYGIQNLRLAGANLYHLPFPDCSFDGCIIADVIEHLYEPLIALRQASRVLKQGGILLLSTPNPFAGARAWKYWYDHPHPWEKDNLWRSVGNREDEKREEGAHIQYFDPLSLCNLLTDVGFTIIEVTTANLSFPSTPFSLKREPLL